MALGQSPCLPRQHLHVDVHHEDGTYWAEVRELPGCFASGEQPAELLEAVEEAVVVYLADPDTEEAPPVSIKLAGLNLSAEIGASAGSHSS
jgi:predicted RNase H-like HicB family nuclease